MDWYHLTLFVHILGVLGLFMALAVELASMLGAHRARTVEAVRLWSSLGKPLAVAFPISSLLILGSGLGMTFGVWGWGYAWIDLSLALLVLLSIVGRAVNGAHAKRIAERATALGQGPVPDELRHALNDPAHWTSVISMVLLALGIVFLMVEKPGWVGSVVALVTALLVGGILARVLARTGQTRVTPPDGQAAAEQTTTLSTKG